MTYNLSQHIDLVESLFKFLDNLLSIQCLSLYVVHKASSEFLPDAKGPKFIW